MRRILCLLLLLTISYQVTFAQTETDCPTPEIPTTPIRFAYIEEGDLWLWDVHTDPVEAQPARLIDSDDVSSVNIAPDGQVIAFTRQLTESQHELWAIDADGSSERLLVSAEQFSTMRTETPEPDGYGIHDMEWIADSHTLAFNTRVFYADGLYIAVADDLWTVNADTTELVNVLPRGEGGEFLYSPDGSQIAIMTPTQLSLVNADGTNRRDDLLGDNFIAIGWGEYYQFPSLSWTADNRTLWITTSNGPDPFPAEGSFSSVWTLDTETLVDEIPLVVQAFVSSPRLSPDNAYLASWNIVDEQANTRTLSIASVQTSVPAFELTDTMLTFEAWSPDSRHFIYRDSAYQLQLANLCGKVQPVPIEDSANVIVHWIDEGRYLSTNLDTNEVRLNTTDGSSIVLSTTTNFDWTLIEE